MSGTQLAKAYVQIIPSAAGIQSKLTQELGGSGKAAGSSFGGSLISTVKAAILSAGIGTALKAAITEGADLQQSLGGVETLFKDSAESVKAAAYDAYKTAGMSANDYMSMVTGFSASLLQSLSGDTAKAAQVADMAMTDMSDNMNKMGSDMESIKNAYQGFAKQNYTMLDNLKLGYGGTKSEMARLLKDAQKISGVKYDLNNLADVYSAIHVIQTELGITGTTAKEASETISGSAQALAAAFSNVLGNLTLGQDIGPSLEALLQTARTFLLDNLLPAVVNIIRSLPKAIATVLSEAMPTNMVDIAVAMINGLSEGVSTSVPQLLGRVLPLLKEFSGRIRSNAGILVDAGINLILNLGQGIVNSIPAIVQNVPQIVTNICGIINDNAPKLLAAGLKLLINLGRGIIDAWPLIKESIPQILESIMALFSAANWMKIGTKLMSSITQGAKSASPSNLLKLGNDFVNWVSKAISDGLPKLLAQGGKVISNLGSGVISGFPGFVQVLGNLFTNIGSVIANILPTIVSYGSQLIGNLIVGIQSFLPNLIKVAGDLMKSFGAKILSALPGMLNAGANLIGKVAGGIVQNLPALLSSGGKALVELLALITSKFPEFLSKGLEIVGKLGAGLINAIPGLLADAWELIVDLKDAFLEYDWIELGKDIVRGLINGLGAMGGALWTAAENVARKALNAIKGFLGIKSPSRRMRDEVGKFVPLGVAVGITENLSPINAAMDTLAGVTASRKLRTQLQVGMRASSSASTGMAQRSISGGEVHVHLHIQNFNNNTENDLDELVDMIARALQHRMERSAAAW